MSKKKLLSEAQVKRFMGLAGLKPLNEMYHMKEDEPLMEEEDEAPDMDMGAPEPPMDMEDEAAEEPVDADLDIDEEEIEEFKMAADKVAEMAAKLAGAAGGEVGMEDEVPDMPEEDEDMDMDLEDDEEEMDMDKELQEVDMELSEDEIVNEVARRVAKRIVEAKRAHKKMNEALGRKTPSRRRRRK